MLLDLEDELLRAAQAFCAWREHVVHDAERHGFTCAEVLAFIQQTSAQTAFPRISHALLAHVVEGLAESLSQHGHLERVGQGLYEWSEQALVHLGREPAYLRDEPWLPSTAEVALRRT